VFPDIFLIIILPPIDNAYHLKCLTRCYAVQLYSLWPCLREVLLGEVVDPARESNCDGAYAIEAYFSYFDE
jgi:hypothetical protein